MPMRKRHKKRKRSSSSSTLFALAIPLVLSTAFATKQDIEHLLRVCTSSRAAITSWLRGTFAADVSMGNERIAVPVRVSTLSRPLQACEQLLTLLDFVYSVKCRYPVPWHRHALSRDAAATAQRNALVQRVLRGRHVCVTIAQSCDNAKGWCVIAAERIPRGAYIGEYSGDVISTHQMHTRFAQQAATHAMNYVLMLREVASRPNDMDERDATRCSFRALRTIVDATTCGSFTRLINHSCAPNVEMTAVRVDSVVPRLVLFANCDIARGEELTFDYAGGAGIDATAAVDNDERVATRTRCLCGAACCRRFLPSDATV